MENTSQGHSLKIREYFPPDVAAQRLWLQNRMPEVYREKIEQKRVLSADNAFLKFLESWMRRRELSESRITPSAH